MVMPRSTVFVLLPKTAKPFSSAVTSSSPDGRVSRAYTMEAGAERSTRRWVARVVNVEIREAVVGQFDRAVAWASQD